MNNNMLAHTRGYNCYPGSGWRSYGRLIINFHNHRVTSIFFNGAQIWAPDWEYDVRINSSERAR